MKKIAPFLLIALLAAMLAVQSFALPPRIATITIPKVGENTPVIDGVFDPFEGWGEPLVHIDNDSYGDYVTRQDDPSHNTEDIKGYYRWDEKCFYFCCVVKDADHANPSNPGDNPWKGDSMRFDIQTNLESDDLGDTSKYWFALCDDGSVYFFNEKIESVVGGDVLNENGGDYCQAYAVVHDKDTGTTVYEVAVLWEFNTPAGTKIEKGYEFVTAQRVMEMSTDDPEPTQSVQLCGYETDPNNTGTKWFVATLGEAAPEIVIEADPAAEPAAEAEVPAAEAAAPVAEAAAPAQAAPQTFDVGVIAVVAAIISGAGYAISKKKR